MIDLAIAIPTLARGHAAKRDSIVDAAALVFCREGFAGANIDLVAAEAGVSRQTIYNHHGDKESLFVAVVREITTRSNAMFFETLSQFPDKPDDLEAELTAFAVRLRKNCVYNREGRYLRRLIQTEGERYPQLFADWREHGPGKTWSALAARFARLALAGYLELDDPDMAARHFMALINADTQVACMLNEVPSPEEIDRSARAAVRAFLRAYGARREAARIETQQPASA
jgi:AcrR family transcriptional regulator